MNFSTTAVIIAAVAACNGRDPQAQAAKVRAVALDAAPVAIPRAAARDAHPAGVEDAAARGAGAESAVDDLTAPEVEAFHGHVPALPMLSPDGKLVAIEVSEGLGPSSFHTYEVAFVEPGGRVRERIAVVDRALAEALASDARRGDGRPAIQLPTQRLAVAATRITARLAGFTPFAREFDHDAIGRADGELALGGPVLAFHGHRTAGLELRLVSDGAVLHRERIAVRPPQYTDREGGLCGGQPRLAGAWWDPPRRRALLLVIFPGRDLCEDEPALWLVW